MTTRPFPEITGGCWCTFVRYRLLTSPLFCYACHCTDCQKATGSAFALHLSIETYNIKIISEGKPSLITMTPDPSKLQDKSRRALCPKCGTIFWGNDNPWGYAVSELRIGTLDFPSIMEPDLHSFVGSKLSWIAIPKGAKTSQGHYDYKEMWPKSSLKRLEVCIEKFEAAKKSVALQEKNLEDVEREKNENTVDEDGEKTPTAIGELDDVEDDEAFEKRFKETEKALRERLAKLSLKLEGEDKQDASTTTT